MTYVGWLSLDEHMKKFHLWLQREEASLLVRWVHEFYPFTYGVAIVSSPRTSGRSETHRRRRTARLLSFYRGKDGIFLGVENKFKLLLQYVKQPERVVFDNEKDDRTTRGVVWLNSFTRLVYKHGRKLSLLSGWLCVIFKRCFNVVRVILNP